ncbi:hypothetical protein [Amnibacterium endophyticum]|uniref:CHRD domain-containing protein n=1 Tax=Amnibacterium endophyticum TaxID=2109337 RepID=A0ABW4LFW9_9MICO
MKHKKALLAAPALALGIVALGASPAFAAGGGDSYQAHLDALNGSGASGSVTVSLNGDQATVHLTASGLAKSFNGGAFPHVAHIHIGGQHTCPPASADQNGDGVVSTPEAAEYYGKIGTTLTSSGGTGADQALNVKVPAISGGSGTYERTFTINSTTKQALEDNTGVVVVHGLNPATLSKQAQGEKSPLDKSLPLAATAPALCGALVSSQMAMPAGGAETGGGPAPLQTGALALGGGLIAAAGVTLVARRRVARG